MSVFSSEESGDEDEDNEDDSVLLLGMTLC